MSTAEVNASSSNENNNTAADDTQNPPLVRYTELSQNGEVIYQSDTVPVEIAATYLQPRETVAQRNAAMTGEKTSDKYRTFNIPAKFENPDYWQGYSKKEPNPLYRTTAQDYGAEKPSVHSMPTVYRTQSSAFTEHLGKCGIFRYQGLNTAVDKGRYIDKY
ncbi:unnamed protein product [Rotaria socialis]|uniref:Uncharacterized protein n=1 Tax=Rotaria socialis TaxID=392032 RepID=A0A820KCR3_9BILA|nr:unnamed protein product [Rotaria socialis]CAF3406670.1 unnamed protein product [Rotaria socialis]CAF3434939.1 unnamed protein product [Rotaria socialis]CAF3577035.1 unnamed protein product [Rotaria socialis]CAF3634472.1 unnamed protein product [Rotaria socialis]